MKLRQWQECGCSQTDIKLYKKHPQPVLEEIAKCFSDKVHGHVKPCTPSSPDASLFWSTFHVCHSKEFLLHILILCYAGIDSKDYTLVLISKLLSNVVAVQPEFPNKETDSTSL